MAELENNTEISIDLFEDGNRSMSKSERTRLKIMASAARVFAEKGFLEASVQDIADDAGIAKGTVYYYIEKKEDLLLLLIKFGRARLFTKVAKEFDRASSASEKLEIIIRNHLKMVKIIGPVIPFFAHNLLTCDSKVRDIMADFRLQYLSLLESVIEEGVRSGEFRQVEPKNASVAVLGMVIGQLLQHNVFIGKINAKEIATSTMDLVLNGLRSER